MAGSPRARVFATRGLRDRKALDSAVVFKQISQIEAKEKKLSPFQFFSVVDMDQTATKNRLILVAISHPC